MDEKGEQGLKTFVKALVGTNQLHASDKLKYSLQIEKLHKYSESFCQNLNVDMLLESCDDLFSHAARDIITAENTHGKKVLKVIELIENSSQKAPERLAQFVEALKTTNQYDIAKLLM